MNPNISKQAWQRHAERILRRLGLLPPEPRIVIARVPRRRPPWPPPR